MGICDAVFASLQSTVEQMEPMDRYCCLIFDEMSLEPSVVYNEKEDLIEGFHDTSDERRKAFADHAMVFMARGIRKKWKQPVVYYFVENGELL